MRRLGLTWIFAIVALSACDDSSSGGADGAGGAAGGGGSSSGSSGCLPGGALCAEDPGGFALACGSDEYCAYAEGELGENLGECLPRPAECPVEEQPVCGCDGVVYQSPCLAQRVGVTVTGAGRCDAPPDHFGCGQGYCAIGAEYCRGESLGGEAPTYSCAPIPAECAGQPSCDCLSVHGCPPATVPVACQADPDPTIECALI